MYFCCLYKNQKFIENGCLKRMFFSEKEPGSVNWKMYWKNSQLLIWFHCFSKLFEKKADSWNSTPFFSFLGFRIPFCWHIWLTNWLLLRFQRRLYIRDIAFNIPDNVELTKELPCGNCETKNSATRNEIFPFWCILFFLKTNVFRNTEEFSGDTFWHCEKIYRQKF